MLKTKIKGNGFTLLELLIIVFILGVIVTLINLAPRKQGFRELRAFSELLTAQMTTARQQSILQMRTLGLGIQQNRYEFYEYIDQGEKTWKPLRLSDSFWKSYPIPSGVALNVKNSNFAIPLQGKNASSPNIIFLTNGETNPFTVTISSKNVKRQLNIESINGREFKLVEIIK